MPQPPIPGMSFAYNQEAGTDITVVVTLSRKDSSRLEGIRCETAEALLRQAPPTLDHPFCSRSVVSSLGVGILKAGAEARGASWKRGEEGNYHLGDFTRGVVSKVQGAVRSSRTSTNSGAGAVAEEPRFEGDAQAAQAADPARSPPSTAADADGPADAPSATTATLAAEPTDGATVANGPADPSIPGATAALAAVEPKHGATAGA